MTVEGPHPRSLSSQRRKDMTTFPSTSSNVASSGAMPFSSWMNRNSWAKQSLYAFCVRGLQLLVSMR